MSLQGTQEKGFPGFLRGETRKISRPFARRGVIGPRRDSKDISLTILGFLILASARAIVFRPRKTILCDPASSAATCPESDCPQVHKRIHLNIQKHNSTSEDSEHQLYQIIV